ncbi:hypothetical protein [Planomonospora venezuelensis]|uniref:Uncharacterized protein n=1 Tax=Planomonospora venezuelensis TaxID=1999 RepID=A0A841D5W9_PLAVE|nr:hypothetical protein [Planomonospora venezuelensis]MBB5963748.1 hypothetical protein [Planomonospora venezuelensis]GIN02165.1 hypothetical protein Pve01_38230 [Planomonospora venezuelensis]
MGTVSPEVRRAVTSRVDDDDTLRIEWPEPDDGIVVLRHAETGQEHHGADLTGLAVGTWTVWKHGEPLVTDDPGFSLDGLLAYAGRPRSREARAMRTAEGTLAVLVREVEPYVEVTRVRPQDGVVEVEGLIAYGEPLDGEHPAGLVAAARKGPETAGAGTVAGRRFTGTVAIEPLAGEQSRRRVFWDLFAEIRGVRLPLAARLDDVTDKKTRVRFPAQYVGQVRVRPYFTDSESLAVACTIEEENA